MSETEQPAENVVAHFYMKKLTLIALCATAMVGLTCPKAKATDFYVDVLGEAKGNIDVGLKYHYTGLFSDVVYAPTNADCNTQWQVYLDNISLIITNCNSLNLYEFDIVYRRHQPPNSVGGGWIQWRSFRISDIPGMTTCCQNEPVCAARYTPELIHPTCP